MSFFLLLMVAGVAGVPASPGSAAFQQAPAAEVLSARCSLCHVPDGVDPRAKRKWDSALDWAATAADGDLITPGRPEDSPLFVLVRDGNMPPPNTGLPSVPAEEVEVLRQWILGLSSAETAVARPGESLADAMGADAGRTDTAGEAGGDDGAAARRIGNEVRSRPKASMAGSDAPGPRPPIVRWIGRFHPLIVHFPIALLTGSLIATLLMLALRRPSLGVAADFCLGLGALTGPPTAVLGWILAESTSHQGPEIDWHRWLGTSTAILAVAGFLIVRKHPRHRLVVVVALGLAVGVTGHLGGSLTYGSDWLDWPG